MKKVNKSASIGGEVLPVVVNIGGYYDNVEAGKPFEAVSNLNNSFTELRLVYGVDSSNRYAAPENKLIFRVELDNKPVETQEVVEGKKYTANLNLQGVKNVKLRVECVNKDCPLLSITEMSLR
ncbi:NPCBM/NEW2 domain-containing protein [Nostoc sp. UHCC 0702]|nr:NPCBM/NEW2 domain-containing protein [Nostoc sp. UHCC 0702]